MLKKEIWADWNVTLPYKMRSLPNFVRFDCCNCLHYLPSAWADDLWSAQHPSLFYFFFIFGHFILSSLAEHVRSSCSCSFLGLWPRMFGLSQRALCCHKGNLFSWNLSLQFSFQTWLGKPTKCTDKHPGASYRFMFLRTVYNLQQQTCL